MGWCQNSQTGIVWSFWIWSWGFQCAGFKVTCWLVDQPTQSRTIFMNLHERKAFSLAWAERWSHEHELEKRQRPLSITTPTSLSTLFALFSSRAKIYLQNPESCGKKQPFVESSGQKAVAYCFAVWWRGMKIRRRGAWEPNHQQPIETSPPPPLSTTHQRPHPYRSHQPQATSPSFLPQKNPQKSSTISPRVSFPKRSAHTCAFPTQSINSFHWPLTLS